MIHLEKKNGTDFRILNLTDTHLHNCDIPGNHYLRRIHDYTIRELVGKTDPDLITSTGDVCWNGETDAYIHYGKLMEEFGRPWSVVWGNHDNEHHPEGPREVADYWMTHCPHFIYENGPAGMGHGNFVISVEEEGKPVYSVFMTDTHDNAGAGLNRAQLDWLRTQTLEQRSRGCRDGLLALHIPIYAYRLAWEEAFSGICPPRDVPFTETDDPKYWNEGYRNSRGVRYENVSSTPQEDGVLDLIRDTGLIHTVIAGHDHYNDWDILYRGIRLVYSLKTALAGGWIRGINGGTLLTVNGDGLADLHHEFVNTDNFDFTDGAVPVGTGPVSALDIIHIERSGVERRKDGPAGREGYYHNPLSELRNIYTLPFVVTQGHKLFLDFRTGEDGYVSVTLESDFAPKARSPKYTGDCRHQEIEMDVDYDALRHYPVTLIITMFHADVFGLRYE